MKLAQFRQQLPHYITLTRLDKPIGAFLLLWPMLWALWFASDGKPALSVLLIFIVGTWLTRSAGCAINDFADRDVDKHVARTKSRPLTDGKITSREALSVSATLFLVAFLLVLLTNKLTIALSFLALLLAAVYPFMKRYTHFPQIVLGAAFGIAVPMVWAAQTGSLNLIAWVLYLAAIIWAVAYDTYYAMADRADDLRIGVKSTAIFFGNADRLVIAVCQSLFFSLLIFVGMQLGRGMLYFFGVTVAGGFALYQLWITRQREPQQCMKAFLNNNYLGLCVFLGLLADYLLGGLIEP